ncbi:MAG: hypothetical protein FD166_2760 [Bacteroidetes bacterium]|nr:MAG: hypothetical protein FD166_2760 [Bacteroidota bacterium]
MKIYSIAFLALIYPFTLTGQEKSKPLIHEFSVSISNTDVKDRNTSNLTGAGIGYLCFANNRKKVNFGMGISLTNTRQRKNEVYETYLTSYHLLPNTVMPVYSNNLYVWSKDVNYSINSFTFPFLIRYTAGEKFRAFAEAGCYIDINSCTRKGTMMIKTDRYNPEAPWIGYKFRDKGWITMMNYGYSAGFGIFCPAGKNEIIAKLQFRKGLANLGTFNNDLRNTYLLLSLGLRFSADNFLWLSKAR